MKKHMVLHLFCVSLLAMTLLTGCKEEQEQAKKMPPPLVTTFTIKAEDHDYKMNFQGITQGSKAVEIRARVQAIIEKRLYTEGDYVQEGQVLFQLEKDQYEARLNEATAQLKQAEREWNRVRPLYAKNAVSQKERDAALAAYESAKANERIAQINLDYCEVTSPVSGFTGQEQVTPGNLANNGTLLTHVNQTDPLYVYFAFAGTEYMRHAQWAKEGRLTIPQNNAYKANIRLVDGSMYPLDGVVTFVDTKVNPSTGAVQSRAEFTNKDGIILPGQYVRIFLEGAVLKDAILIPQKAVLTTQKGTLVMIVNEQNIVEMRPIKIGTSIGQMYLIDEGLKAGEKIVLDGLVKARPGQPVTLGPPPAADGAQKGPQGAKDTPQAEKAQDGQAPK